jgi:hypothetical protein
VKPQGGTNMPRFVASVFLGLFTSACNESPTAPSSLVPQSVIVGEVVRRQVTDADWVCDPCCTTRCLRYAVTAPRNGLLEVALTWVPRDTEADPLGFSVVAPGGRHWHPDESGVTRRLRVQAERQDIFRIHVWAKPGEEFQLQTSLQ